MIQALVTVLILVLYGLLTAFDKAAHVYVPKRLRQEGLKTGAPPRSFARRLKDPAALFREMATARILCAAAFFIYGGGHAVPLLVRDMDLSETGRGWVTFALIVVLLLIFLIFGRAIPMRAAGGKDGRFAVHIWYLVLPIFAIVRPIERLIRVVSGWALALFRIEEIELVEMAPTEEELLRMLEVSHAHGAIEDDNREFIANLFDFDDKIAAEVMTHRTEIEALPVEADYDETMAFLNMTKFTRVPIYKGSVDNIVGVLHVKDMLFIDRDDDAPFSLEAIMRQAWFTPESRNISDLFREMQQNRIQMTIVIDEYGGTAGLLTVEDLVEQIVGNIEDEYDDAEQDIIEIAPGSWLVAGSFPIDRLARVTGEPFPDDEFDTVAGFVIELLDRIPEEHERPSAHYGALTFYVLAISDNRIVRLRVTRDAEGAASADTEDDR